MKTTLTSVLILSALIGGSIWFQHTTESVCTEFEQQLSAGYDAAVTGGWNTAEERFSALQDGWENQKTLLAIFTHHNLLDEIQSALARVMAATQNQDLTTLRLEHATLKEALTALRHSDTAHLANIF